MCFVKETRFILEMENRNKVKITEKQSHPEMSIVDILICFLQSFPRAYYSIYFLFWNLAI